MKNLNNFIVEKLIVNSKTKVNKNDQIETKDVVDRIVYYFNIDPLNAIDENEKMDYEILNSKISIWVKVSNIKNVIFACDLETLNEFTDFVKDKKHKTDILKEYDTKVILNEKCQELLENSTSFYNHRKTHLQLRYNIDKMICISYKYGTIYCLNTDKF